MFPFRSGTRRHPALAAAVLGLLLAVPVSAAAQEPNTKVAPESGRKAESPSISPWTAVIAGLIGLVAGAVSAQFSSYLQARTEQVKEWQRVRARYLAPLLASIQEIRGWVEVFLKEKLPPPGQPPTAATDQLVGWFQWVKDIAEGKQSREGFFAHCNGMLYFAVSTLHVTAVYFAIVARLRANQPYIRTANFSDRELMDRINRVRDAFSGEDGLWDTLQDSIGTIVTRPDGGTLDYREFCTLLVDEKQYVWLLRMMDFYREIGGKSAKLAEIDRYLADAGEYVQRLSRRRIRFLFGGWIHG